MINISTIVLIAVNLVLLVMNLTIIALILQSKKSLFFTMSIFALFTVALIVIYLLFRKYFPSYFPIGFIFLPLIIILFQEHFLKKVFVVLLQLTIGHAINTFSNMVLLLFLPDRGDLFYILYLISVILLCLTVVSFALRNGRLFLNQLFGSGGTAEWALYTLSAALVYFVIYLLRFVFFGNTIIHFGIIILVMWSFCVMCFAIISTNEKAKQKYEADFMRNIITSSEEHYEKMNELYTSLRIMRHDAKYHQRVVLEFLQNGETAKAIEYLGGLQTELSKYELVNFCDNQVINALLANFAERCEKAGIDFTAKIALNEKCAVCDYDMCIVIGNLLENAFEASRQLETGKKISLDIVSPNEQLILKVTNNFDAKTVSDTEKAENSGLGLRSVQLVTARYGGELLIKQNNDLWTSSILMGTAPVL